MQYEIRKVDELSHHGIQGQKWGVRNYQYKDGSLTEEGRKRYGSLKKSISKWGVRMKEKSEADKQAREEATERKKQNLIENGTPKQIQKNIRLFNSDELSKIERRFSTELKIQDDIERLSKSKEANQSVQNVSSNKSITDATKFVNDNTKNLQSSISNAVKAYNSVAYIHNTLRKDDPDFKAMPIIPEKEEKKKNQSQESSDSD